MIFDVIKFVRFFLILGMFRPYMVEVSAITLKCTEYDYGTSYSFNFHLSEKFSYLEVVVHILSVGKEVFSKYLERMLANAIPALSALPCT